MKRRFRLILECPDCPRQLNLHVDEHSPGLAQFPKVENFHCTTCPGYPAMRILKAWHEVDAPRIVQPIVGQPPPNLPARRVKLN